MALRDVEVEVKTAAAPGTGWRHQLRVFPACREATVAVPSVGPKVWPAALLSSRIHLRASIFIVSKVVSGCFRITAYSSLVRLEVGRSANSS